MDAWIAELSQWLQAHPQWSLGVIFLLTFGEAIAIVGTLVPGSTLLFSVGALIGLGVVDVFSATAAAIAGALLGDCLSFHLGQRLQDRIHHTWPFNRSPKLLQQGIHFFEHHGGKSVILARLIGPIRAFVPVSAGLLAMPPRRYYLYAVVAALIWAPAYMLPGQWLGQQLQGADDLNQIILWLAIGGGGFCLLLVWATKALLPKSNGT